MCDFALFVGASVENAKYRGEQWGELAKSCCALKMYLGETYGTLHLGDDFSMWSTFFEHLPRGKVICVHAERTCIAAVVLLAQMYRRHVHVCHVSKRDEILMIKAAKEQKVQITCEVCPHHLFLTMDAAERTLPAPSCASVKPSLGTSLRTFPKVLLLLLRVMHLFASEYFTKGFLEVFSNLA